MPIACNFKGPMLAANALPTGDMSERAVQAAIARLTFPLLLSPKLDGIRGLRFEESDYGDCMYSRKLKPIPNRYIQEMMSHYPELEGLDGELMVGDENDPNAMQNTTSGIMTIGGEPDFTFHVFDTIDPSFIAEPFLARWEFARDCITDAGTPDFVKMVPQLKIANGDNLLEAEEHYVGLGYEGVMLRPADGRYKQGRSSYNEGLLFKWKRMVDDEAEIIGVVEQMQNNNAATKNALGKTQRLGGKKKHTGKGTLGALICRTRKGVVFQVGTGKGLNDSLRARLWAVRDTLPGEYLKFESFAASGVKNLPRFPRIKKLLGIRWKGDM